MTLTEMLDRFNVDYKTSGHEHCRSGWIQMDCPDCSPGWRHYRLGLSTSGRHMNCWACGPKKTIRTLAEITGQPYKEIASLIGTTDREVETVTKAGGVLKLPSGLCPLKSVHRKYLKKRNFDPDELVRLWGIQGLGMEARRLAWRIFIPVLFRGKTVSWTTRSVSSQHSRRYLAAPADSEKINHKDLLYGEDYCSDTIVVCEGPTDVWRVGPGAVCTFGTGFRRAQILRMSKYPYRYVCYDNEEEGQKRAKELVDLLSVFDGHTFNVVLDSKDPGSATPKEIRALRKEAFGHESGFYLRS